MRQNNHLMNMKFDNIKNAASFHDVIHYLYVNRSIDEKDKLVDELIIRRMEKIRDNLINSAYTYFDEEHKNAKTTT